MKIADLLDDPNDPAPELEFLRKWEEARQSYREEERKRGIKPHQIHMTEEEFF